MNRSTTASRRFKRLSATVALGAALGLSLVACGDDGDSGSDASDDERSSAAAPTEEPANPSRDDRWSLSTHQLLRSVPHRPLLLLLPVVAVGDAWMWTVGDHDQPDLVAEGGELPRNFVDDDRAQRVTEQETRSVGLHFTNRHDALGCDLLE